MPFEFLIRIGSLYTFDNRIAKFFHLPIASYRLRPSFEMGANCHIWASALGPVDIHLDAIRAATRFQFAI